MSARDALVAAVVDEHLRLRDLVRAAAVAPEAERDAACSVLLRHLAVHTAAEAVALEGARPTLRAVREADELAEAAERLEDLGTSGPTYGVRLALLTAGVVRHVETVEHDLLPRVAAARDDEDLARGAELLAAPDALGVTRSPEREDPGRTSFRHEVRRARERAVALAHHRPGVGGHRAG